MTPDEMHMEGEMEDQIQQEDERYEDTSELECIDCDTTENVSLEHPGYGYKSFPRCPTCADSRRERERENKRRNFGPEPGDFDPGYCGERWED